EMRSTCSRIPESSFAMRSISASESSSRARRATCRTCSRSITALILCEPQVPRAGPPQGTIPRVVSPQSAERFVVASLRLLAAACALVGLLFIIAPDGVLGTLDEIGEWFGDFTPAPASDERLWLGLAFAYMVVITAVCLVAQADVARYRPLLLVL